MRYLRFWSLMTAVCFFTSCSMNYTPTRNFSYTPAVLQGTEIPETGKVLVVKKLGEARGPRTYPSLMGNMFKSYIPLLPYVRISYERLDESDRMTLARYNADGFTAQDFSTLIAKTMTDDLTSTGMFKEVRYIGEGEVPEDADYVLSGDLKSTNFDYAISSYMLGMAGVLLWLLPIPLGKNRATVEVPLVLTDKSGTKLWSHNLQGTSHKTFMLYNSAGKALSSVFSLEIRRFGKNDEGVDGDSFWAYHASAVRAGMVETKQSLAQFLATTY